MNIIDYEDTAKEYNKKIIAIENWSIDNIWFDGSDILPLKFSLKQNGFLAPNQQLEIDNVIDQYKIKW